MDNNSFLNHLETLCNALKEGNKEMVMLKLKQVKVYFAEYKPDLWSIRVQGLLQSLLGVTSNIVTPDDMPSMFTSYNEADITPDTYKPELPNIHFTAEVSTPLIFELIEKANIQLSTGEKNDVLYLVREYSRLTDVEGKMVYKSQFEPSSNEWLMDIMATDEALLRSDYNFFIDTINSNNVNNSNSLTIPFTTPLNKEQLTSLLQQLKNDIFIENETHINNWLYIFGKEVPKEWKFKAVKWIKKNSRNWKTLNKKSLIDLLQLIGVNTKDIDFKDKVNLLFNDNKGSSINLTGSNLNGNKTNNNSEYFNVLRTILSNLPPAKLNLKP